MKEINRSLTIFLLYARSSLTVTSHFISGQYRITVPVSVTYLTTASPYIVYTQTDFNFSQVIPITQRLGQDLLAKASNLSTHKSILLPSKLLLRSEQIIVRDFTAAKGDLKDTRRTLPKLQGMEETEKTAHFSSQESPLIPPKLFIEYIIEFDL